MSVGTGGVGHYVLGTPITGSEVGTTFGVPRLTLNTNGAASQFLPVSGQTFPDFGTQTCHRHDVWCRRARPPAPPGGVDPRC
jgi:hypothetical protein